MLDGEKGTAMGEAGRGVPNLHNGAPKGKTVAETLPLSISVSSIEFIRATRGEGIGEFEVLHEVESEKSDINKKEFEIGIPALQEELAEIWSLEETLTLVTVVHSSLGAETIGEEETGALQSELPKPRLELGSFALEADTTLARALASTEPTQEMVATEEEQTP